MWQLVGPLVRGVAYALKFLWWILFGWWLDPIEQERSNARLRYDLKASLACLFPEGSFVISNRTAIQPFDYASAWILFGNLIFCFTRGRGELNVTIAPRHMPIEAHDLSMVLAVLESKHTSISGLAEVDALLAPRLAELNNAFSEQQYPSVRDRLP